MSRQESLLISSVIHNSSMRRAIREGITTDMFLTYREEWDWLSRQNKIPSRNVFEAEFPNFRLRRVKTTDTDSIIKSLKESYVQKRLAMSIEKHAKQIGKVDPLKIANNFRNDISSIIDVGETGGAIELLKSSSKYVREFRRKQRVTEKGEQVGISTGIPSIDNWTGGLMPSQLYVIIARQGHAKTYWMLHMAAQAVLEGYNILWVSREMPDDMITYRVHSILSTILRGPDNSFSNLGLILGKDTVSYDDYRRFITEVKRKARGKFFIPENRRIGIKSLDTHIERHNPDIVFYDYIGIIGSTDGGRGWQELGAQINHAKEIAMHNKIPVVVASQVNRASKDVEEAPMVENISFSDSIGYAADVVFSLQLSAIEHFDKDLESYYKFLEVWIRKGRYGLNDVHATVKFDGDRGYLQEIEGPRELVFEKEEREPEPDTDENVDYADRSVAIKKKRRGRKRRNGATP